MKVQLLKEYVMSKRMLFVKMGQVEMECNSEITSDANGVYLEANFYFYSLWY